MIRYVVGLAFNQGRVLLIHKLKGPDAVRGFWNGVGGKVEEGESMLAAMAREFHEEADVETRLTAWEPRVQLKGTSRQWEVVFFIAHLSDEDAAACRTMEEEPVQWFPLTDLPDVAKNLHWILPFVQSEKSLLATVYEDDGGPR